MTKDLVLLNYFERTNSIEESLKPRLLNISNRIGIIRGRARYVNKDIKKKVLQANLVENLTTAGRVLNHVFKKNKSVFFNILKKEKGFIDRLVLIKKTRSYIKIRKKEFLIIKEKYIYPCAKSQKNKEGRIFFKNTKYWLSSCKKKIKKVSFFKSVSINKAKNQKTIERIKLTRDKKFLNIQKKSYASLPLFDSLIITNKNSEESFYNHKKEPLKFFTNNKKFPVKFFQKSFIIKPKEKLAWVGMDQGEDTPKESSAEKFSFLKTFPNFQKEMTGYSIIGSQITTQYFRSRIKNTLYNLNVDLLKRRHILSFYNQNALDFILKSFNVTKKNELKKNVFFSDTLNEKRLHIISAGKKGVICEYFEKRGFLPLTHLKMIINRNYEESFFKTQGPKIVSNTSFIYIPSTIEIFIKKNWGPRIRNFVVTKLHFFKIKTHLNGFWRHKQKTIKRKKILVSPLKLRKFWNISSVNKMEKRTQNINLQEGHKEIRLFELKKRIKGINKNFSFNCFLVNDLLNTKNSMEQLKTKNEKNLHDIKLIAQLKTLHQL